jgi:hypothetical protein
MASRHAIDNTELSLAAKSVRQKIECGPEVYWGQFHGEGPASEAYTSSKLQPRSKP